VLISMESQRIDVSSQCVWYVFCDVSEIFGWKCHWLVFKTVYFQNVYTDRSCFLKASGTTNDWYTLHQNIMRQRPWHQLPFVNSFYIAQTIVFPNTTRIKTASLWDWGSTWTVISPNLSSTQIGQIWDQSCSINLNRFRFIDPESKNIEKWQPKKLRYLQQFTPLRCRITLEEHFGKNSL